MPVRLSPVNLDLEGKTFHHFLQDCQAQGLKTRRSPIISYSQFIRPLDLLSLLNAIDPQRHPHFYWENQNLQQGILAYGSVQSLTINSTHRFERSRQFVEDCLAGIRCFGARPADFSARHRIFCSFSFFDRSPSLPTPYPNATLFLPEFQITQNRQLFTLTLNFKLDRFPDIPLLIENIKHQVEQVQNFKRPAPSEQESQHFPLLTSFSTEQVNPFTATIQKALAAIATQQFSKIVLAHALDLTFPQPIQPVLSLRNLRKQYGNCYVFSTSSGQGHCFLGASPERLTCIHDGQLVADALAGSIPRGKNPTEDRALASQLLNSEKERREHQAVIDFILHQLRQLGLNPYSSPLSLLQLSNIQHLWTPIHASLPRPLHPLEIVAALHPTPAVAGVPTPIVCDEIRRYETFDRGLYAAPLGWVDGAGNGEFIVGIRSALLQGDRARLYAGAGIVAGSDPERELAEIHLKFQALLRALA